MTRARRAVLAALLAPVLAGPVSEEGVFCAAAPLPAAQVSPASGERKTVPHASRPTPLLSPGEVESLLVKPACLESFADSAHACRALDLSIPSGGILLAATLYLPLEGEKWPAVILVPGGFNETELIMRAPRYEAPRLAHCGIAALVFYKRGTGLSGGVYADATHDDFIDDVGSIARALARRPDLDGARIGVMGGSSGGFVASIAAARCPEIAFAVNKSGPIVTREEESNTNIEYALKSRGFADSLVSGVMPLWRRYHAAWDRADTTALVEISGEIREFRNRYDPAMLPTPFEEVFTDSSLAFLWPMFRSASRDYLSELRTMRTPWLSIYGEQDPIVPVGSCVRNIDSLMNESGNDAYTIIVLPGVDHSFIDPETRRQVPVLRIVLNWLARR